MTSVWNKPTVQMMLTRLTDGEQRALSSLQIAPKQMEAVLNDVVASARGKIKAGGFQLGPDGTVPDSLRVEVISVALWLWITGTPGNKNLQTDGRKQNYDDAMKTLGKVSCGEQRIELPDPGVIDQSIEPSISPRPRRFRHEDGI